MKRILSLVVCFFAIAFQPVSIMAACISGDVTPPVKSTDFKINAIYSSGVIYSFTEPTDMSSLAQIDLRWRTIPLTALNWATATQATDEPFPSASGVQEHINTNGLSPNVTYYMALKIKDACGNWSAMSNVVSMTPVVSSKRTVVLLWDPPMIDINLVAGYKLYYGYKSFYNDSTWVKDEYTIDPGNVLTQNVILDPGTYYFRVTALYGGGIESDFSNEVTLTFP